MQMKTLDIINNTIDRFPKGYIFTYADFYGKVNSKEAIVKCLNRMALNGKIKKLSKGKYYKPEISVFGELKPTQYQVVKDLLEQNGKIIGYISGYGAFNEMGLTTQMSSIIQIGRNDFRPSFKRDFYKISFIKQKNSITEKNVKILKVLDVIRFIKNIPDTTIDEACFKLINIVKAFKASDQEKMIRLTLNYPPATRALVGAMLEFINVAKEIELLRKSLKPITYYKLSVSNEILPTAKNWNIR